MLISPGIWPTMITPYDQGGHPDMDALAPLIEWYVSHGVHGLFAVCQSSEMFFLTLDERVALARRVVELVRGRVGVIASGHVSDDLDGQVEEIRAIWETGIDAFVLVVNRVLRPGGTLEEFKSHVGRLLDACPDIPFGFYECPYPQKVMLTPEMLRWCADTGRFHFLKDTCCDIHEIRRRLQALAGGPMGLFNANSATFLASLRAGAAGFSGVMGNFHPDLYRWVFDHQADRPALADQVADFLGVSSAQEARAYPLNAKYYLTLEGVPLQVSTRVPGLVLPECFKEEARQLHRLSAWIRDQIAG